MKIDALLEETVSLLRLEVPFPDDSLLKLSRNYRHARRYRPAGREVYQDMAAPADDKELERLTDDFVRNEIYYLEARVMEVVKQRMRRQMEFIFEDITAQTKPLDEELKTYMKEKF